MSAPGPERRRILVTGAAGSIGAHLLPLLRERGWTTRALVHRRPVPAADERVVGDLSDQRSLRDALDAVDAVIHLAAVTHARDPKKYDVNVRGTESLVSLAPPSLLRFVHVSTRAIDPDGGAYSRSKLAAEKVVASASVPWTIVRLPEVYGGNGTEGVDDIIARARAGAPIRVVGAGNQQLCPIHVEDVGHALAASVTSASAVECTYTLLGECMTVEELARRVGRIFGTTSRVVRVPRAAVALLGPVARFVPLPLYPDQLARLESPKARPDGDAAGDLDFTPMRLEDALAPG